MALSRAAFLAAAFMCSSSSSNTTKCSSQTTAERKVSNVPVSHSNVMQEFIPSSSTYRMGEIVLNAHGETQVKIPYVEGESEPPPPPKES